MNFLERLKYNFQREAVLTQIVVINLAVFLVVRFGHMFGLNVLGQVAMPIGGGDFIVKFWTLFTYMFTHFDFFHFFWNMVSFYFMAQILTTIMGQKKILYLYVMSGLCGGALVLILSLLFPASFGNAILLGASASVLGVGAVMAIYSPNFMVYLFGMFEMRYRNFYILVFVITTVLDLVAKTGEEITLGDNAGGKIAHIGGAAFGLLYGYYLKRGNDLFNFSFSLKRKSKLTVVSNTGTRSKPHSPQGKSDEQKMNELLDKISKSGYDSLTKSERDELFRLSQKK